MGSNASVLVAATLNSETVNYADGGNADHVRGTPVYNTLAFSRNGFTSATNERLAYATGSHTPAGGTLFCRFRTNQAFADTLNTEYYLLYLGVRDDDTNYNNHATIADRVSVLLHYTDAQSFDGIEVIIRKGASLKRLTVPDLDFDNDSVHSVAVTWRLDADEGDGVLAIYLDGRLVQGTTYTSANEPTVDTLWVGNANTVGNRPSLCDVGDVLYVTEQLQTAAIEALHGAALDVGCVDDTTIYQPAWVMNGYSRTSLEVCVKEYDQSTGRWWGHTTGSSGVLLYSVDPTAAAASWGTFADLGAAIKAVFVIGSNIYVGLEGSLKRSDKTAASFSEVLAMSGSDSRVVNGWNHTTYTTGGTTHIVVCEYENMPGANNANRVLHSTDGSNWDEVKALTGSEEHFHAVAYDPATGRLWATTGDTSEGIYYSDDHGENWSIAVNTATNASAAIVQAILPVFRSDETRVVFASDSVSARCQLHVFDSDNPHAFAAIGAEMSLCAPMTGLYAANVYALSKVGIRKLLWYANHEGNNPGRNSSIWVSPDFGRTVMLAEDLTSTQLNEPHKAIAHGNAVFIGDNKIVMPTFTKDGAPLEGSARRRRRAICGGAA